MFLLVSLAGYFGWNRGPQGEDLARTYCSGCHTFPEPELLSQKSWNYLLTYMGIYLGITDYHYLDGSPSIVFYNIDSKEQTLRTLGLIPDRPLLSVVQWDAIRQYYHDQAPETALPQRSPTPVRDSLPLFQSHNPTEAFPEAVITMARIDNKKKQLILADSRTSNLSFYDQTLGKTASYPGYNLIVDEEVRGDSLFLLSIGDLMGRNAGIATGYLQLSIGKTDQLIPSRRIIQNLKRPDDMEFVDLDGNGTEEIIICNFGDAQGSIALYQSGPEGYTFVKDLLEVPGAIRAIAHDFDQDGRKDLAVLMSHARENITIFFNQGDFEFRPQTVVETNPAFGHTYFELQDFNQDGHMDLLVVNGDSDADPYNTLKNYHGIRIYLNQADGTFEESYFYPFYGAHFAKAADFDQDGDLDIAAIAFLPDFSAEVRQQFVYLENTGELQFQPSTHPATHQGRWMVMDVGDYDGDRDIDILLGAGYLPIGMSVEYLELFQQLKQEGEAFLLLENVGQP